MVERQGAGRTLVNGALLPVRRLDARRPPNIPCIVYAAKSSPDEKDSTATQLVQGRETIARAGGRTIAAELSEDNVSGSKGERGPHWPPQWQQRATRPLSTARRNYGSALVACGPRRRQEGPSVVVKGL
jgi:hypothetical protein